MKINGIEEISYKYNLGTLSNIVLIILKQICRQTLIKFNFTCFLYVGINDSLFIYFYYGLKYLIILSV